MITIIIFTIIGIYIYMLIIVLIIIIIRYVGIYVLCFLTHTAV